MNKIELKDSDLNKEIYLKDDSVISIKDLNGDINYKIDKDIKIFIYLESSELDITFDIISSCILNIFSFNSSLITNLNLNKEDVSIDYVYSTLNKDDNNYTLNINHNSKDQSSNIVNHGINLENNKLDFIVNAIVPKTSSNITTNQDNKILVMGDNNSSIKPNLLIDNDDIEAEHSAYIGDFKKEVLFYLESRGIKEEDAKKFLAKYFLTGNMNISYLEMDLILNKLDKYWR